MKLLHWYYDIMNLYGEYGNVRALERILQKSGENVTVERRTLGDKLTLSDYDFIYIGSGTERNQKVVLNDLRNYREQLGDAIKSGKVMLMTGNSFETLGKAITDAQGEKHEGLGLYDFTVTEQNRSRETADAVFEADFLSSPLVGFINKCSEIQGIAKPMFSVKLGLGNEKGSRGEGMRDGNLFMTHLTGPVLISNPHFLVYLASLILGREPESGYLEYEKKGYDVCVTELMKSEEK